MDKEEFADSLKDCHAFLVALQRLLPKHVDADLVRYLDRLSDDPAGRELLRNALRPNC